MTVHARPRASTSAIVGIHGDAVAVRVTVPSIDGRANDAVARVVAEAVDVAPSAVALVAGASARTERFEIHGPDPLDLVARLRARLEALAGA